MTDLCAGCAAMATIAEASGAHVHTIPVDPSLTVAEAWKELCIFGRRVTNTGEETWAIVTCDRSECASIES